MKKLTFSSPVATAEFSKLADILSAALSQHHVSGFDLDDQFKKSQIAVDLGKTKR